MQAHHLISTSAVKDTKMEVLLEDIRGYDINHHKNLVFLPGTLQGACHLSVQPHRGDHTTPIEEDIDDIYDDDEDHPDAYHRKIFKRLKAIEPEIRSCEDNTEKSVEETYKILNRTSSVILSFIRNFKLPLTNIFEDFLNDSDIGCGNCIDVKEHENNAGPCTAMNPKNPSLRRNHIGKIHPLYKSGRYPKTITIKKEIYKPKVGQ